MRRIHRTSKKKEPDHPPSATTAASPQEAPKPLDVSTCALILFPRGPDIPICAGVQALPVSFINSFNALVAALERRKAAVPDAPEIKTRMTPLKDACDRILEDIVDVERSTDKRFPDATLQHVDDAESATTELHLWAKAIASGKLGASVTMTKQARLQVMPYIVAIGYTARIRAIARLVEREMASQERDRARHLKRACEAMDDAVALMDKAMEKLLPDTTLLEVAFDYDLPIAMYLTLMGRFRASIEAVRSPGAGPQDVPAFDDGLAPLRNIFQWKSSGDGDQAQNSTIELSNIPESLWWARFTDTDIHAADAGNLRKTITLREIAQALGGESADGAATLAIKPGLKSALLQLPPASTLRPALRAAVARAYHAAPPHSFANTTAAAPPPPPAPATLPRWLRWLRWLPWLPRPTRAPAMKNLRLQADTPRTLKGHTSTVYGVAVCPDGERVVSGSADGTVRLWSLSTGQHLRTFSDHTNWVNCVAVSPEGKRAVSGSADKSVRVWSVDSGSAQRTLQGHTDSVLAVAVSPDGRSIASGSEDETVRLWDVDTGQCHATLTGHYSTVWCVAFSPDGQTLVSGSGYTSLYGSWDTSIKVWNVRTRALQRTLNGHSKPVYGVAVTPDGQWLVSGSLDCTVRVWRLSSGEQEMRFEGHSNYVSCVAVFPDGLRIASGSRDSTVRVWNLRSRMLELTLRGHSECVTSVAVSPDGRSVVSGSGDKTIKVWALSESG